MNKISNFQLYCMLLISVVPLAFLITPRFLTISLTNNAWLAIIASIIPGYLLIYIYGYILSKSQQPFPLLLEEHLGLIAGKIIGVSYILFFLLLGSFTLRIFVEFVETNVLPGTPISVFIGILLVSGLAGIKTGLINLARLCEIIVFIGVPFTILMLAISVANNPDFYNLQPLGNLNYTGLTRALLFATIPLLQMLPVLALAPFTAHPERVTRTMLKVMFTYVLIIGLTVVTTIVSLGADNANYFIFPTFIAIRFINIGEFIQNIDIVFIGVWVLGIFGVLTLWWFMICFTIQNVFGLHDYRFLAAPTTLIIGSLSLLISPNILQLQILMTRVLPWIYVFFLLFIPLIIFLITLFTKPVKQQSELFSAKSE
jgi:spore germination protein KB